MLSKQAKAELQRMIDKGAEHMRQQGHVSIDGDNTCLYRGLKGAKCFIGALIPDEHYTSCIESKGIIAIVVLKTLKKAGYKVDYKGFTYALDQAQRQLHDKLVRTTRAFLPAFEAALERYCNEYGLIYRAPGEKL